MSKLSLFSSIYLLILFTKITAQVPQAKGNEWLKYLGENRQEVTSNLIGLKNYDGRLWNNNKGTLIKLRFLHIGGGPQFRIAGFQFLSQSYAQNIKKQINQELNAYTDPLPFGLKFGMSSDDLQKIFPDGELDTKPNSSGITSFRVQSLPSMSRTSLHASLDAGKLVMLAIDWKDASIYKDQFRCPDPSKYDIQKAYEDKAAIEKQYQLDFKGMKTLFGSILRVDLNRPFKQLFEAASKSKYSNLDSLEQIVTTFCNEGFHYDLSLYLYLENSLKYALIDKSHINQTITGDLLIRKYTGIPDIKDDNSYGYFYYSKEEEEYFTYNYFFPVAHLYAIKGSNEVVLDIRNFGYKRKQALSGNGWLRYLNQNKKSPAIKDLIEWTNNYKTGKVSGDNALTIELKKFGIKLFTQNFSFDDKALLSVQVVKFYSANDPSHPKAYAYKGELPLGMYFGYSKRILLDAGFEEVNPNCYKWVQDSLIECKVFFNKEGLISSVEYKSTNIQLSSEAWLRKMDALKITDFPELPIPDRSGSFFKSKFKMAYQHACTPEDENLAIDKEAYMKEKGYDFSADLITAFEGKKENLLLSILGKVSESPILIEISNQFYHLRAPNNLGWLYFGGGLGKYDGYLSGKKDEKFDDIILINNIVLEGNSLKKGLFGLSPDMPDKKVKKLFPKKLYKKIDEKRALVENYNGFDFSFQYRPGNKLLRVRIKKH